LGVACWIRAVISPPWSRSRIMDSTTTCGDG
jgi:hypothetical protein